MLPNGYMPELNIEDVVFKYTGPIRRGNPRTSRLHDILVPRFQKVLSLPEGSFFTLTGSRASGLAYPESDIDCTFVAKDIDTLNLIAEKHSQELGLGSDLNIIHTRAGLPWCPVEGFVDEEYEILAHTAYGRDTSMRSRGIVGPTIHFRHTY